MRAPFQILAIPYKIINSSPLYCVFHRADFDQWQFIAGGGEDDDPHEELCRLYARGLQRAYLCRRSAVGQLQGQRKAGAA